MKSRLRNRLPYLSVVALCLMTLINTGFAQQSSNEPKPAAQPESEVKLPDTAAAKTFAAFLKAFNSGDKEIMKKFHTDHAGNPENAEKDMGFYQQSGGLKVISVGKSSDYALEVIVETKNGQRRLNFAIEVDSQAPYAIQGIRVQPV